MAVGRRFPGVFIRLSLAVAVLAGCATDGGEPADASGVCTPFARKCRDKVLLMCRSDGQEWVLSNSCPLVCADGACIGDAPDAAAPDEVAGERRGCLACACDFGERCDDGLMCFAGFCLPRGCQVDGDCPDGRRCYLGGCIPGACGNAQPDPGEACDDGNNRNGDGCNVNCDLEATRPLAGGEPLGFTAEPGALPVAFSACDDPDRTGPWAPGDTVPVRVCAVSWLDASGQGLSAAEVAAEVEAAARFYASGGTAIRLDLVRTDVVQGGPDQTDPDTMDEIDALLRRLRQDADAAHPGECPVVLGYVHSLADGGVAFGGMGSWPVTGIHSALITTGNVAAVPGQTTAHELGHVIGLYHTFEPSTPDDDGCPDTAGDANCLGGPPSCDVTCPDGSRPPSPNVMSYYFCTDARSDSFSGCQARRARCFLSKMFPDAPCPLPVLQNPSEGQVVRAGEAIDFSWKAGRAGAQHEVIVRRSPSGDVAWQGSGGSGTVLTLPSGNLEVGAYAWTVRYPSSCCPDGRCEGVERRFQVQAVPCDGPTSLACGRCGRQSRTCQADGNFGEFGPCTGQGECEPFATRACPGGAGVTCTDDCSWPACPDCVPDCTGKCRGAGDGCGGTCAANACDGCCDGTACQPGDDGNACGAWGGPCRVCGAGAWCLDGTCDGCSHDEGEAGACDTNDTPDCAANLATVASEKDQWVPMAHPASPSPADDADHFVVGLTSTDFFAVLDPEVVVSNRSGIALEACLWWRNADGSAASLANDACSAGNESPHPADGFGWDLAPGCCLAIPDLADGRGPHFYVTDLPGEALVRIRPLGDAGACGRYSFQVHL